MWTLRLDVYLPKGRVMTTVLWESDEENRMDHPCNC